MRIRYRLKNKKRFITIILSFIIIIICASSFTVAAFSKPPIYQTVSVKPGDTLWEIADKYSQDTEIREYIYKIKAINDLDSANIYAGQKLYLPEK